MARSNSGRSLACKPPKSTMWIVASSDEDAGVAEECDEASEVVKGEDSIRTLASMVSREIVLVGGFGLGWRVGCPRAKPTVTSTKPPCARPTFLMVGRSRPRVRWALRYGLYGNVEVTAGIKGEQRLRLPQVRSWSGADVNEPGLAVGP